jgi:peptide/nickel transport system permease protein
MGAYVLRRLLATVPTLLLVSVMVFVIVHLTPGDPVTFMLGDEATPEVAQALRHRMGLDQPLPIQYVKWLARAGTGDLGRSIRSNQPVSEAILQRIPVSIELTLAALLISLAISVPAGVLSATRRNSALDTGATVTALLGVSMPNFLLGFLLIYLFAVKLRLLPPSGWSPLDEGLASNLKSVIMPALTLGAAAAAIVTRMTRSALLEVLGLDYVRTARAKGLAENRVVLKHALKNALVPVVTIVGLQVGHLMGGAIITETLFSLPGMGRLIVDAINTRDYPVVQGVVLFAAVIFVFANLAVDLTYGALDPRIRYS